MSEDTPESVRERAAQLRKDGDPWELPAMLERYAALLKGHETLRSMYADMLERYTEIQERSAGVWVPVTERLPDTNNPVQTHTPGSYCYTNWVRRDGHWLTGSPTHWLDVKLP